MSATRIVLDYHIGDIEIQCEEHDVYLNLIPDDDGEPSVGKTLSASEARALGSALFHYANEVDR